MLLILSVKYYANQLVLKYIKTLVNSTINSIAVLFKSSMKFKCWINLTLLVLETSTSDKFWLYSCCYIGH